MAIFSPTTQTRVRRFSVEIQGADAQNPRIDARTIDALAAYAAESGRVERTDADLGRTRSRLSSRGNAGAPERRAEGTREEGNLLADWARPEAERAEVSSAVHQEDMVEVLICVATRRASAGKSDMDSGSSLLFDLRFGRKGANLIWNLTFRSSYRILLQMFGCVTKFNRSTLC